MAQGHLPGPHGGPTRRQDYGPVTHRPKMSNGPKPTGRIPATFLPAGKLGRAVRGKDPLSLHLNVLGLQHFLRNKGYDVKVDGKLGPLTKQALSSAIHSGVLTHASAAEMHAIKGVQGNMGPKAFDAMVAHAGTPPYKPLTGKGGMISKSGNLNMGGGGGGGGGNGSVNPTSTNQALKASAGHNLPAAEANFGQLFNVDPTAKAMAAEQFQPQINEQQLMVNRDPVQAAQNEKDVKDWYAQALAAQQAAGQADTAATKQGVDATNAQTQALVQSLGGGANQGSGEAAAAGQNASGTLQAIGAAQQGLDAQLAPILAAQAAQQQTDQRNVDQAKLQSDQLGLQNLQGQEGNAQMTAQEQLQSANNSLDQARQQALMQIQEYNNSLSQQKYQNQLGMMSAQIAAAMNGVTMQKNAAETNYYNARAAHAGSGGLSASQLSDIAKNMMGAMASKGMIVQTPTGYKMAPGYKPQQLLQFAQSYSSGYGQVPGNFDATTLSGIAGY